ARRRAGVVEDDGVARKRQRDLEGGGRFEVEEWPRLGRGGAVAADDYRLEAEGFLTGSNDDGSHALSRGSERDRGRTSRTRQREDLRRARDARVAIEDREHRGAGPL